MKKTNVIKRIIALLVLSSTVVSLFGCFEPTTYTYHGVEYENTHLGWSVVSIDRPICDSKNIYVLDEINGEPVETFGVVDFFGIRSPYHIDNYGIERLYLPWSIKHANNERSSWSYQTWESEWETDTLKYVISPSLSVLVGTYARGLKFIIPLRKYVEMFSKETIRYDYNVFLPANISYFFNYEDNPNEGYFFVDLVEESGKLTKPPYDPKREGYTFDGWYSDKECTTVWNFENDIVTIEFDENGERIYEEICLYAKWVENN